MASSGLARRLLRLPAHTVHIGCRPAVAPIRAFHFTSSFRLEKPGSHARTDSDVEIIHPPEHELPLSKPVPAAGGQYVKPTLPTFSLDGNVGVVTGGARGLGLVIGQGMVFSGADLALVDLNSWSAVGSELGATLTNHSQRTRLRSSAICSFRHLRKKIPAPSMFQMLQRTMPMFPIQTLSRRVLRRSSRPTVRLTTSSPRPDSPKILKLSTIQLIACANSGA